MSDALRQAIEEIQGKINSHIAEIGDLKKAANALCRIIGSDPLYTDSESEQSGAVSPARADAYYGKPLSTAAREYLEFRKQACPPEEILRGLEQGGFDFDALGWKGEHRLRSLSVSMAKNTAIFRRLPNGMFGLKAWYQDAVPLRRRGKGRPEEVPQTGLSPTDEIDEVLKLPDQDEEIKAETSNGEQGDTKVEAASEVETTEPDEEENK